jgi:PAS domain S-box-containing protein
VSRGDDAVSEPNDLLDTAPAGFLSFADDGVLTRVNRTLLDLLGYEREEVVGRHVERLLTVGSRIFYQTHWFPLLRLHGRAEEIFVMFRSRGGEDLGMLVNAARYERHGGVAYDCVLMRVQERQKFEDELLRARRAAERAREDVEAQASELRRANDLLEAQAVELEMQQEQLRDQAAELETASEELRAINDHLLQRTEEAERLRVVADEANQAKSRFLAVMSHELRTPLNAIAGYVQLMELGIHGPISEAQRETLERITRSERHLLRLINEVLNLARIEAGHVEYVLEDVPVAELVEGVAPMVEPQLERKGVAFEVDIPPQLVARVDREKGQQILINLLGNATKFTPPGGRVAVHAEPSPISPDQLCLRVADTGIGIPRDKLVEIFQPFVQVDSSRTREAEGSGLGLAISRDLARGMGGDLRAESEAGAGSTFTWVLPLASAPAHVGPAADIVRSM